MDGRRNDTKKRLIVFILDQIIQNGYVNISQRRIAKDFGITHAAIYNHFKSKENMLFDVLKAASNKAYSMYIKERHAETNTVDPIDNMVYWGRFFLKMFRESRHLMEFIFFSPTALRAYAAQSKTTRKSFKLQNEAIRLVDCIIAEYNIQTNRDVVFTKLWSFLQGYSMLVATSAADYDGTILRSSIHDVIAGDRHCING